MSSKPTIEPPAIKKRGRPKKVVAEDAGTTPEVAASKAVVKKAAAKLSTKEKVVEVKKEKKVTTKSGKTAPTTTATVAAGKKIAPKSAIAPAQATPVTPSTSKILEEVEAKGTLKKAKQPEKVVEKEAEASVQDSRKTAASSQSPETSPPKTQSLQSKPTPPTTASLSNNKTASNTTSRTTTTIPLPSVPKIAPSPVYPATPKPTTSRPHNPYPSIRPSPSQPQPRPPPSPYQKQHPTRIIEPTPDIRLPPKYKPAARRVTAIIVGLPIIFVVGYELFERWRGKDVRKKFVEDREVLKQIDRERERQEGSK
ncbi:hypothetical protein CC77DRAFT_1015887 [Alternaria alternata]|uniref:Uncharacterized protein n=1 Tax=Alternaria alternata TaxID=5599 RepID=A0A177E6G6_ALTAL|nr:hypothetical protein CC77DRAFT_1015887 [Alternaria alternata]OAG26609.1 hypothetical protein CC77DRAFT_1015887 [Alternaria alternata]